MASVRHAENKKTMGLNNGKYKDLQEALAGEKLLRDEEVGTGQAKDTGRGNGSRQARQKKLLIGNTRNTLSRESKLHNYKNSVDDPEDMLSSMRDVLVADSKVSGVEPLSEHDRKREMQMEMTTQQVTLAELSKQNFKNRSNMLNDFTFVGY